MTAKTPKRPRDPNQLAKLVVDIAVGEAQTEPSTTGSSDHAILSSAGVKGGAARAKSLSPEQRSHIAKIAAKSRWNDNGDKRKKES